MTLPERPKIPSGGIEIEEDKKGGMKMPSGSMMGYIIMAVIAIVASFAVNYFFAVPKTGIESFKTEVNAKVDALSSDLRASTSSIKTNLESTIPNSIDTKINSALNNVQTRLNTVEGQITTAKDNSTTAVTNASQAMVLLNSIQGDIETIQADIASHKIAIQALQPTGNVTLSTLNTSLTEALAKITILESKVTNLQSTVTYLQTQSLLASITINTTSANYSLATGVVNNVPLSLTNSSDSSINIPMKFVMTTSGSVVITGVAMTNATVSVSGTTVTCYITITVPANSTLSSSIPTAISYTGTSPNTWTGVWSKQ